MALGMYRRNNWGFIILIGLIALAWAISQNYITLDSIKQMRTDLKMHVHEHYLFSVIMFMLTYILTAAISLPIAALLTLTGGFLFGTAQGFVLSTVSATLGATLAFLAIRALWGKVQGKFNMERFSAYREQLVNAGFWYLLALRFFTLIPFFLVTILAALSPISISEFILATAIGIMPACLIFSYAGSQLAHINSVNEILTLPMIILLGILAFFSLIPALFRRGPN